ncbi:hypothetical protein F5148DRAFT_497014 [Russula earlei]|uniref:Uncharacterized protein n=1 Tax=Russula earlei TaxID=71964 RepID=A0ACC0TYE9_9AGAM|nr:hypothetical protein F5148DRAFT_497014 [Russula earlei]
MIFHIYVNHEDIGPSGWHTLVHVCQRWRCIVFASPRRLNLQLVYTGKRPMSDMLDVWPVLPVVISPGKNRLHDRCWGHIAAFLESEHHHPTHAITSPYVPLSFWERLVAAMQKPFPELTSLDLWMVVNPVMTSLPDSFFRRISPTSPTSLVVRLSVSRNTKPTFVCQSPCQPSSFGIFPIPVTFRLGLWSPPSHRCHALTHFVSNSYPILVDIWKTSLGLRLPALSSPLSPNLCSTALTSTWRTYLPKSKLPFSTNSRYRSFTDVDFVVPQLHRFISHAESFKTCNDAFVGIYKNASISREPHNPSETPLGYEVQRVRVAGQVLQLILTPPFHCAKTRDRGP